MRIAGGLSRGKQRSRIPIQSTSRVSILLIIVLVAGNLLAIPPVSAQATEPFATASVVPDDLVSYTVVPLRDDSAQWAQAVALLERAGLGPSLEQLGAEALGTGSEDELPVDLFLGGEVALVVSEVAIELLIAESVAGAMAEPGVASSAPFESTEALTAIGLAVVVTADAPSFIEASFQEAVADTAAELGTDVEVAEHAGVSIEYVTVPAGSDETPIAVARVDDFVLVGGYPADLEPLIETSAGDRPSLADLDAFGAVQAALDQEHLAFGYFNGFPSEATRSALRNAGLPGDIISGESAPGGFVVTANELGFGLETVSLGTGSGGATGFPEPLVLAQTPSGVMLFFAATDLAGTGLLDAIGIFLLSASGLVGPPGDAGSLDEMLDAQFAELERVIGVNLRTELLVHLTGDYGFWLQLDQLSGAISALFASGVADPSAVAGALLQITLLVQNAGSGQIEVISRPVGEESRVYVVETGDPIVPRVEYGVVEEQLVVGLGDAVDNVGEGPEQPLTENERFQTIMGALPEASSGMIYVDLQQAMPLLTSTVDAANMDQLTGAGGAGADIRPVIDPAGGDAHPDCARFGSQAEAQAAYDDFAPGSFQLDQDFDGVACEDFFNPPAEASPVAEELTPPSETAAGIGVSPESLAAFTAFGLVSFEEDGNGRTSSLLLIEEAEE